jgi:membrane protease YdiL (CAAX protease family)
VNLGAAATAPAGTKRKQALQLALFMAAFFAVWSLRAVVFIAYDEAIASPVWRAAYSDFLKLILWVAPAAWFAQRYRKAPPWRSLGLGVMPEVRTWSVCLAVTAAFLGTVCLFEIGFGAKSLSASSLLSVPLALVLLQLLLSPLLEEIFFRGFVMRELLGLLPAAGASVLASLLFAGAHLPYWLSHRPLGEALLADVVGVFLFSLLACWLFARSLSIWPCAVAHVANNLLSSALVSAQAQILP